MEARSGAIVRELKRDPLHIEAVYVVAYRREYSRVFARKVRVAEQWSTRGAHCEEGSNTSDEEFPVEWICFWNKVEGWRSLDNG